MIRTLALVAVVGFVLSIACIGTAFAIAGGPFGIRDWMMVHGAEWDWDSHDHHRGRHHGRDRMVLEDGAEAEASVTRDFTWSGGDRLQIDAPADIVFTQGPTTKLSIQGPKAMVDRLTVREGRIALDGDVYEGGRLKVVMTGPKIRRFDLSGSQNLVVENYAQDRLTLDMSGDAQVSAKGRAATVVLDIAGSGDADLAELSMDDAQIDISGSGKAKLGPKTSARVDVSGDGEVTLTTKPVKLTTDISGSGRVTQPGVPN